MTARSSQTNDGPRAAGHKSTSPNKARSQTAATTTGSSSNNNATGTAAPNTADVAWSPSGELATGPEPTGTATVGATIGHVVAAVQPENLPVRDGEHPWTGDELGSVQAQLESDLARLAEQINLSETELVGLLHDSSQGAGRDSADVGTTNFERDHEATLADNARDLLNQTRDALHHLASGTYGRCDNCGRPIGKLRLQAFPRATLCIECKQQQERR